MCLPRYLKEYHVFSEEPTIMLTRGNPRVWWEDIMRTVEGVKCAGGYNEHYGGRLLIKSFISMEPFALTSSYCTYDIPRCTDDTLWYTREHDVKGQYDVSSSSFVLPLRRLS